MAWKKASGTYVLDVDVPANQTATVAIPNPGGVKYVGVGAGAPQLVGTANGYTTFTVGSGATHFRIGDSQTGGVGGTVPATLSLTLGAPASFGAFTPGVAKDYTATTTANVISTAGDAALTVSDPGHLTNGAFSPAGAAAGRDHAQHVDAAGVQCDLADHVQAAHQRQ